MRRVVSRALVVVFCAMPSACGACHGSNAATEQDQVVSGSAATAGIEVGVAAPIPAHWTDEIAARIVFDETHTSRVGAPLGGRVSAVMVELGQNVKAGAPLLTVTSGDLADLRGTLEKAKVDLRASETNYQRVKALVEAESLPRKELVAAEQDLKEARLAKATAEQKISSLKVQSGGDTTFTLSAPRDGVIVEKTVSIGQQVSPDNGSLLAIADLSDVWVVGDLLQDAVDDITSGSKAEVRIEGLAKPFSGVVEQISAVVDPDRHTVPLRVRIDNPIGALRPNALAQVRFFEDRIGPLSVPASAILSDGAASYVYVEHDGTYKRVEVVAGPPNAGMVPIRSGLAAGDRIVTRGVVLLENQMPSEDLGGRSPHP